MSEEPKNEKKEGEGEGAANAGPEELEDRIQWIESRVNSKLKIQKELFKKMFDHDANFKKAVQDFVDNEDTLRLFILDQGRDLVAMTRPPQTFPKKKSMYVVKHRPMRLSEDIAHQVSCNDLAPNILHHVANVTQEVYLPIVSNAENQEGWPDIIRKEVCDSFHRFLGDVQVTIGQVEGQMLLPLPPTDVSNPEKACKDKDRVHILESAVVLWTRQIKNVLKIDPEAPLKAGLNPGPNVELEFWAAKAANLNSIYDQLQSDKIRKVTRILEMTKNTYLPAFNRLCKEVAQARQEANDNCVHLNCLQHTFQQLATEPDFPQLVEVFKPMMHLILLIWKHSKYYNTPARLVVIVREICNDIIAQARSFVKGEELFKIEPQDAVDRLKLTLQVCGAFKSQYFEYKTRVNTETPNNPWRIQNNALFHRLDSFLERCHDILDLTQTILQFNKLEKIEVGGTKGKTLTNSVRQVFIDFQHAITRFQNVTYDVMDVEAKVFDDDFYEFRSQIKELERRLGSVLLQGFDDCATVFGALKLLESFEGLSEREIIQTDVQKKYMDLLSAYEDDLLQVQKMFVAQKEAGTYPIHNNLPPTSGAVYWLNGLRERIQEPMEKLKQMPIIIDTEEAKEIIKVYDSLIVTFGEFQKDKIQEWFNDVEQTSQQKLKQTLLLRDDDTRLLTVNFDPALVRLLREVKYFLLLKLEVPDAAMSVYKKAETFRTQTGNLDMIVNKYNEMIQTLLPVEKPLVENQLNEIDINLEKGLKHLTWKSHGINEFINSATKMVKDASRIVSILKGNVREMQKMLQSWADNAMFERKEQKTYSVEDFQQRQATLMSQRNNEIGEAGSKIHELLMSSNKALRVSKGAPTWKAYVDYVNRLVSDGYVNAIAVNLRYLNSQVDPAAIVKSDINPLLEIKLELVGNEVFFNPVLGAGGNQKGVQDIVEDWILGFLRTTNLTKRLDTGDDSFMKEAEDSALIKYYMDSIFTHIFTNRDKCDEFSRAFLEYDYLWTEDMNEAFKKFLIECAEKPEESEEGEGDAAAAKKDEDEEEEDTTPLREPPLSEFDVRIAKYRSLQDAIGRLPNVQNLGWLRIDAKPIKQALGTTVTKWAYMFTNHLSNRVVNGLQELNDFMEKGSAGLEKEVEEGDLPALIEVMGYIRDVRVRMGDTDDMFEPMKDIISLLKKYGIALPDTVTTQLEETPLAWAAFKKKTWAVKEKLNPLVNQEAEKIKGTGNKFTDKVKDFRSTFSSTAPFMYDFSIGDAFHSIDDYQRQLVQMEKDTVAFNDKQELFELNVSEFKEIKDTRNELVLLKTLWDMISLVTSQFDEWRATPWEKVDTDYLMEETKALQKLVTQLNKNVRGWDAYKGLWDSVKNMVTALPLVQDLRDPAMRDRHWKKLMRVSGIHFTIDENFSLESLMNLKLHNFVDDVTAIVDQARQEFKIEKQLAKIDSAWAVLSLDFGVYKDTDVNILKPVEEVVEQLEDDMVLLQNMMAGKYVAYFEEQVVSWRTKLGTVDSVLTQWTDVQRSWTSLESIFIGSQDIRRQLPEDSKRFDGIDADWKELMKVAVNTPQVVEACTVPGRGDVLERMQVDLEKCEKSLAEYLETKRRAFPRFYFISPADQVDILSKGSFPHQVMEHLSKLFTMQTLNFEEDDKGNRNNVATGMVSLEGEEVDFPVTFKCEGQVETWLTGVEDVMRKSLRGILGDSVQAYMERPRTEWLFDFCAQLVVATAQVWWTTEVSTAFDRLEEGNENAVKDYNKQQIDKLADLTTLVLGELSKEDRVKIITLITIEVHARDVVTKMVTDKVESGSSFAWQSQLRYAWDEELKTCVINIADASFTYGYEFIGNCGRLVITPLTDRCYITLTQALKLIMGGAPAGPAGTGKTETTKDLGRGLGMPVYVFNCSEEMDYKSMANIYKGLCMTGAWGCFDEFNRIAIEVLSVVATQVKTILDAVKAKKSRFQFMDDEISLIPTVGLFITMNPGYKGRTELPENLKALFRPVAMVVPDFELICEIMLQSEGFIEAKILAKKFVTLYQLNKELLSKQDHYDWGLRAIKSILVIAGVLKRAEPDLAEDMVLMRALRDNNLPKIVNDDVQIFLGLITDLFPGLELPRKRDVKLEDAVKSAVADGSGLQAEDSFVMKCVQLSEIMDVRHSVFVLGPPASGKSSIWKMLAKAKSKITGLKTNFSVLNPKAVETRELYGYMHPVTREPKDGIIAKIMRDYSKTANQNLKWIVLDGDIDAGWIESMNTVMDDNKVLTLVSNERIPLNATMRLIFEIGHLKNATPATVSRAGILFINETDIGWRPFVQSWVEKRGDHIEMGILSQLFDIYCEPALEHVRKNFKHVVPVSSFNMIQTLCFLLDALIVPETVPNGSDKEVYEHFFVFAAVWAIGGAFVPEKTVDYQKQFSTWWKQEFNKSPVKFPDDDLVFDFSIDPTTKKLTRWSDSVPPYVNAGDGFSNILVPTVDTVRTQYIMDLLIQNGHPVLLVGGAGTGKSQVAKDKLKTLNDDYMPWIINFHCYADARTLQFIMEQPLEKKAGMIFGPPGTKKLVYFIDDLNMPLPDVYGTQSAIALLRQHMDYGAFYDLHKMTLKEVQSVQYIAAMNPTAGTFTVDDRLQRHFGVLGFASPKPEILETIYASILNSHLSNFSPDVSKLSPKIVSAAVDLHRKMMDSFLPNAIKFHYQWNLRDLSNVFQGLLNAKADLFNQPMYLARLWFHESWRVYGDRLINENDLNLFDDEIDRTARQFFEDLDQEEFTAKPIIYTNFALAASQDEKTYYFISDYDKLKKILTDRLNEYNETNAAMDLVLFEQAMEHVCRISRIIDNPKGNALLVGVGGSGKQSLARLSAFISEYDVVQITVTASYGVADFKLDLASLYQKAGLKNQELVFMITDQQIVEERFLVYINDLLSSGSIPDLFTPEEKENMSNSVRNEVKQAGIMDTKENCWDFFVDKVRNNLHVVLCFSPVGESFRVRCRQFPALVSCTAIDWFQPWPKEALVSVASRFLSEVDLGGEEVRENISHHMAFVQNSVNEACTVFLQEERRFNYTTPKSYLEFIALYKKLLADKREELNSLKERLENGLVKLRTSAAEVADMQVVLQEEQALVEEKKEATDKLLVQVGQEAKVAEEQAAVAAVEEEKTNAVKDRVQAIADEAKADLEAAEPALAAAEQALNSLNKPSLTELKSLASPPKDVLDVTTAVMYLTAAPKTDFKRMDTTWNSAKKMMAQVDRFLADLINFDKDNIPVENVKWVEKYTAEPTFNGENIKSKSKAAAGLCDWVCNIVIYHKIFLDVEPKRIKLAEAQEELAEAEEKLRIVTEKVQKLEERRAKLTAEFEQATEEKNKLIEQAEKTKKRLNLAERLVNGLGDENERWAENVDTLKDQYVALIGDALLASAFIVYVAPFSRKFRDQLVKNQWIPDIVSREIPLSDNIDPLETITDDAKVASWAGEGLPADRLSVENGAVVTSAERWPLLIDPQLQGSTWIKQREGEALKVIQLNQRKYLDVIERAIMNGEPVLIENVGETVDAVLDPVLSRSLIKRGRTMVIKLGDKEVEYDPNFKLYIQTKLPKPHYRPEIAAQTTLVNFTVTEDGLEDQLLAVVVNQEKPELEERRMGLVREQNEYKIKLKELEDDLLARLSNAEGDILSDEALIESLENTKKTAIEIREKVELAKLTEVEINEAREFFRPAAARASLLYFLIDSLSVIDHMYQYSLTAFMYIFNKALARAEPSEEAETRLTNIIDSTTFTIFTYVSRGLFERHKLVFSTQMAFRILLKAEEIEADMLDFLVRGPRKAEKGMDNPLQEWLSDQSWAGLLAVSEQFEPFQPLANDVEGSAKRWKEWTDAEQPENEPLPQEWKKIPTFQKLVIMRIMRPDRMTSALTQFVAEALGQKYVEAIPFAMDEPYSDSSRANPIFFLLSPGSDPVRSVEALGAKLGYTADAGKFDAVSLGQGQEVVAKRMLEKAAKEGSWVMLQNIHLVAKWLPELEKMLEQYAEEAHEDFRVFLSADPSPAIPVGVLQNSVKLTNEAPAGLRANILRAFGTFTDELFEGSTKQAEFKSIIFALCFFHAVVLERKKFGPQGWNRPYPFNQGDLTVSITVVQNQLESAIKIPWEDLRYIIGEIMYGGHITDDWDRRLCNTYLSIWVREDLLEGIDFFPGLSSPGPLSHAQYIEFINEHLDKETPIAYGLHSNSEIGYMTTQGDTLFEHLLELAPGASAGGAGMSLQDKVKNILDDIQEKLPENLDIVDATERLEERTPFNNVFLQECDRMNYLLVEMKRSLAELDLGLKGDLTMSERMETLMVSLFNDKVPETWEGRAYPSMRPLASWLSNLIERHAQLNTWIGELQNPKCAWLSGFFNPQSYLTAVMQTTARKNEWPLDKMTIVTEVTKKNPEDISAAAREGAFISGLYLEGARWDGNAGALETAKLKQLFPPMPVIQVKAILNEKVDNSGNYLCPCYKTQERGPTYVFTANLKAKTHPSRWVVAGVALLLDVVE